MAYSPRLKDKYRSEVVPALMKEFNFKSPMQVPKLEKICLNQGLGIAVSDKKLYKQARKDFSNGDYEASKQNLLILAHRLGVEHWCFKDALWETDDFWYGAITGSSDYHGTGKTGHDLGVNTTDPAQWERLLERTKARVGAYETVDTGRGSGEGGQGE
jgi:hypothetical protein